MKETFRISALIAKEIKGAINHQEQEELNTWLNESPENKATYKKLVDRAHQLDQLKKYKSFNQERGWSKIEGELFAPKVIQLFPRKVLKYAAAILIPMLLAGGLGYLYMADFSNNAMADLEMTIEPGSKKAVLILSDGGKHALSMENNESKFKDGLVDITNNENFLSYSSTGDTFQEFKPVTYNQLITPLGGGYSLELADGSKIWLNSGSSLKFPASFTDSTRQVYLEGEAYFEVAHNGLPFIVTSGDMDIRVMGTSFNVSAYNDDLQMKTTLVEGKVRVDYLDPDQETEFREILLPNKQATVDLNGHGIQIAEVDASQYKSWVDGKLEFNNEALITVLKKLSRWYDFEFEFENKSAMDYHFSGRLDNQENFANILEMLEMTTNVKFEVVDHKIIVQ